jgi:glycosyltransferase involved in cell wall biosynthesis
MDSSQHKPLISIITVCYNAEKTISRSIESVRRIKDQFPGEIEYVIIDGGSNDNTVDIISKYGNVCDFSLSEPDEGIYDAMNKGIKYCNGTYVANLNSDDYFKTESLNDIIRFLKNENYDCVYGNISGIFNEKQKIVKPISDERARKYGYLVPIIMQPAAFIKKEVFNKIGGFDPEYKIAGDTDFLIRFIKDVSFTKFYFDTVFTYFDTNGVSNKEVLNYREISLLRKKNKIPLPKFARYICESTMKKILFRSLMRFGVLIR